MAHEQIEQVLATIPGILDGHGRSNGYQVHPLNSHGNANTKAAKLTFRESALPLISDQDIYEVFGPDITIQGTKGETGLTIEDHQDNGIIGIVRHPNWIPRYGTDEEGQERVQFGGRQTAEHIEILTGEVFSETEDRAVASDIVQAVRNNLTPPYGALMIGVERELNKTDRRTGRNESADLDVQCEPQRGIQENALDPYDSVEGTMIAWSLDVIKQATMDKQRGVMSLELGVPPTGDPSDEGIQTNNNPDELGLYVRAICTILSGYMVSPDALARQTGDYIAHRLGKGSLDQLVDETPQIPYWANLAGHAAVAEANVEGPIGHRVSKRKIADLGNNVKSRMGALLEILTFSSPFLFNEDPGVEIDGVRFYPLDYRNTLRNIMATTFPGDPLQSPQHMDENLNALIISGGVHTADRGFYFTRFTLKNGLWSPVPPMTAVSDIKDPYLEVPSMHESVRLRMAVKDRKKDMLGRVEAIGSGASLFTADVAARNYLLEALALLSQLAASQGKTSAELIGSYFPSLADWRNPQELTREYNLYKTNASNVRRLADECAGRDGFLEYMMYQFPTKIHGLRIAQMRIQNLFADADARDFKTYRAKGSVGHPTQVMKNMADRHQDILQIVTSAHDDYQIPTALSVINHYGDVMPVLKGIID